MSKTKVMSDILYLVTDWGGPKFQCKSVDALTAELERRKVEFAKISAMRCLSPSSRSSVRATQQKSLFTLVIRKPL